MQKIIMVKNAEGHLAGEVLEVNNNDAHRLIDGKKAKLWYPDKMMRPEDVVKERPAKRRYKTKGRKWQL